MWDNCNDLDLSVEEPEGSKISYLNTVSSTGGMLDIDKNAVSCKEHSPIENIQWDINNSNVIP